VKQYWAGLPTAEFLPEIAKRIHKYNRHIENKGLRNKWERKYDFYYGRHLGEESTASGSVEFVGDDGELTAYGVNHFRNLIQHILALTTSQKPDFDPRAENTDLDVIQRTKVAAIVLDSYLDEKRLNRYFVEAAERALVLDRGHLIMTWNPSLGRPVAPAPVVGKDGQPVIDENGRPKEKIQYEGDVSCSAKGPMDCGYDTDIKDYSKRNWIWFREWENKWDLAARHPEKADEILDMDSEDELAGTGIKDITGMENDQDCDEDDLIPVYYFIHKATDALPNGRFTKFLNREISLFDGESPYEDRIPEFRITPGAMFDSGEGYSPANDLMALQEAYNVLISIPFSNQQNFAAQAIHLPEGCEVSGEQLGRGAVILKGGMPGTEPKALQLTATPAEVFTNLQVVESAMEKISGVNSVVRGDPQSNLKSGAALGRMQAMAIQFSSNYQRSWAELLEDGGSFLFFLLQRFAKTERIAGRVGRANRAAMTAFSGDTFKGISGVAVDLGNPLTRTAAGRQEVADKLLDKGMLKNPQQYFTVAKTGNLEPATEAPENENDFIRKENEDLMDGKPAKALVGDKHILHAQEHRTILNDPLIRAKAAAGDPLAMRIVQNVLDHIAEHKNLHMTQDPFFAVISGEPPPPPPMPPPGMMPPGPGGGPPLPPPPMGPPQQPPDAPPIPPMPPLPPANPVM
jgi:hypothetical protein